MALLINNLKNKEQELITVLDAELNSSHLKKNSTLDAAGLHSTILLTPRTSLPKKTDH